MVEFSICKTNRKCKYNQQIDKKEKKYKKTDRCSGCLKTFCTHKKLDGHMRKFHFYTWRIHLCQFEWPKKNKMFKYTFAFSEFNAFGSDDSIHRCVNTGQIVHFAYKWHHG